MWLMNEVLKAFLGKFVIVYLEYTFNFSKLLDKNIVHIHRVFEKLREDFFFISL